MPQINLKSSQAQTFTTGPVEFVAAKGDSQPAQFRMVVYAGSMLTGHWYWGNVVIDVSGVKPTRQDIAALEDHDPKLVAGYTTAILPKTNQVLIEGALLDGTMEEEPAAARVRRRLASKFPYQASGRWMPRKIEKVEAGQSAMVNGKKVTGPATIFRETDIAEASFVPMAWDPRTEAMAAGAAHDDTVNVEEIHASTPEGDQHMTTELKPAAAPETTPAKPPEKKGMLAMLADIFGADKAIALVTARPQVTEIAGFVEDLVAELGSVRAALTTAQGKCTSLEGELSTLKIELAGAKKAPVVVAAAATPATPPADAPAAGSDDALKAEWQKSKDLQAEFPDVNWYIAAKQRDARRDG